MLCEFDRTGIVPGLPGILLIGHGRFASGLLDAARMIFDSLENVAAICLEPGDSLEKFRNRLSDILEAFPKGSIVLADMMGGTPCRELLYFAKTAGMELNALTGASLPMLMEVIGSRESAQNSALVEQALFGAQQGTVDLTPFLTIKA